MTTGSRPGEEVKWWLILVAVLAVLASGVVLLVRQFLVIPDPAPLTPPPPPAPAPTPPPSSSAPASSPSANPEDPRIVRSAGAPLLPGMGAGDVFVQSATAIYRIELATGRITRTPTPDLEQFSSFVAGPGWVVFKTVDNDTGVVVRNGRPAAPLPPGLRLDGRLRPAPHGDLWLMPEEATNRTRVVTRVDINGHPVNNETIRLPDKTGILGSDGAGYLAKASAGGVYQFTPSGPHRLSSGELVAVGAHHLLIWNCDHQARCNPYRIDRAHHHATMLPTDHQPILDLYQGNPAQAQDFDGGDLSPDGSHAALPFLGRTPGAWPLAALDLATGRTDILPGSYTSSNPNTKLAWTPNSRWLLAITDHQMRGYDTTTHTTHTITFTNEPLLHLTTPGASGN